MKISITWKEKLKLKVLVAHITAECNEHVSSQADLKDFQLLYEKDCIDAMHVKDIFESEGIELVPSIYACLNPSGMIKKEAYLTIVETILDTIKKHLSEIDGIYLQLHGASGVVGLEEVSGEHYTLRKIREIVGKYMPIAVVMDPHGNVTKTLINQVNIVRCYRQSPHSDTVDTQRIVAYKLIDLLKNRRSMRPVIRKLPIMVGGERSVSAKEPMLSINRLLDEAEKDPRVFSDSYHVGYIRHDDDKLGAAVVVIPNMAKDTAYCEKIAEQISEYAWVHRHEFQFSGNFDEPEESVKRAIAFKGKTAVITDSGDNCGAGGAGQNTILLKEMLQQDLQGKSVLIAGINDPQTHDLLSNHTIGEHISIDLGVGENKWCEPIHIEVILKKVGEEAYGLGATHTVGDAYTVNVANSNLDIMVLDRNVQYGNMEQFQKAGLDFHDYDIVVVKMGYLDTYLIPETAFHIMALTDGPTIQRSEKIPFRKIYRPMWPIDHVEKLTYIE